MLNFPVGATGTGSFPISIPNNLGLVSAVLFAQALPIDIGRNTANLVASNSLRITVGYR